MSIGTAVPTNPTIYTNAGTLIAGLANAFRPALNGYVGTVEDKAQLTQAYLEQLISGIGNGWQSGGIITAAGTGLSVTISPYQAMVGNVVSNDATGTVGGFTDGTVNYLFLRQDGSWTPQTSLTPPGTADNHGTAVFWGSALAASGNISAVYNNRPLFPVHGVTFVGTASVTIANSNTETTVLGGGLGELILRPNTLSLGKTYRLKLKGFLSDTGTPTLNIKFKLGGSTVCSTGAITLITSLANHLLEIDVEFTCRTIGATGTIIAQGKMMYDDPAHAGTMAGMVSTGTTTIDTTGSIVIDVTATWGSASSSNTLTITNVLIEEVL